DGRRHLARRQARFQLLQTANNLTLLAALAAPGPRTTLGMGHEREEWTVQHCIPLVNNHSAIRVTTGFDRTSAGEFERHQGENARKKSRTVPNSRRVGGRSFQPEPRNPGSAGAGLFALRWLGVASVAIAVIRSFLSGQSVTVG